jgi:flagellar P-ring protein precursor FlgI
MALLMRRAVTLAAAVGVLLATSAPVPAVRLKDIAAIEGVRENQLSGYGLVTGLNGTGDSQQSIFTVQSVLNMLRRQGLTLNENPRQLQVKNVASVMVTAALPPFARQGGRIDVQVSSLGDAKKKLSKRAIKRAPTSLNARVGP